jgi:hypothetical protein
LGDDGQGQVEELDEKSAVIAEKRVHGFGFMVVACGKGLGFQVSGVSNNWQWIYWAGGNYSG